MDWIQTLSIIGTVLASAYFIHRDTKGDVSATREEIKAQSLRTDRLYEMFIDLLKDRK